jgi:hypothetical protein
VKTVKYTPALNIRNADALPAGTGCKYLICISGPDGQLVAKQWCRKMPPERPGETVVKFGK